MAPGIRAGWTPAGHCRPARRPTSSPRFSTATSTGTIRNCPWTPDSLRPCQAGGHCVPGPGMVPALSVAALLLLLPVGLTIVLPAFAHLRPVLVDAQPAFQFLGAALLLRRRVPFALLFAQGFKFLLQGIVTR